MAEREYIIKRLEDALLAVAWAETYVWAGKKDRAHGSIQEAHAALREVARLIGFRPKESPEHV